MESTQKKIRILQVCAIDETVKSLLLPLMDRLIREGFEVTGCCSNGKNTETLKCKGYQIRNVEIARSINLKSNLLSVMKLRKLMKEEKYDIVHVHTPVAALLARVAAKLAGTPIVIYTAHGFYFHDRMQKLKYRILVWIEKFAGRLLTDYIFTQSEEDRLTAIQEGIIKSDRITTISNGVDVMHKFHPQNIEPEIIAKKKAKLNIGEKDKVVMFIGRLVKEKGIIELLQAFNAIKGGNYKLLLVGDRFTAERDTGTYKQIMKIAQENPNIIMTGIRSDISDLLALSDLFVLPSYREGMPRSIIEAMAMGKPVIATNIRGCREEVEEGKTGFLVPVNDPDTMRDRMEKILGDNALAAEMGRNARVRAEMFFDEEKVLDKEVRIIRQLIEEKIKRVR